MATCSVLSRKMSSIEDVIEQIKKEHPNEIEFALNGHSNVKNRLFRDFTRLHEALQFLATTYLNSKRGAVQCNDLVKACKEECGCDLLHPNPYKTTYKGRKLELHGQLIRGWWKHKRFRIRVAFEYLADRQIVVVGQIG
jgi:hypothetical protein